MTSPTAIGRAVLDANVLYAISLRDILLRAAERGLFVPLWSPLILDEVQRNLVKHGRESDKVQRMIAAMRRRFPRAERSVPEELISQMTNAVEDRHVLAVAVAADAAIIVTMNRKDFPLSSVRPLGIVLHSPDDFLCLLFDSWPEEMTHIVHEQSEELTRPRLTTGDVLDRLAKQAPTFAARARAMIE